MLGSFVRLERSYQRDLGKCCTALLALFHDLVVVLLHIYLRQAPADRRGLEISSINKPSLATRFYYCRCSQKGVASLKILIQYFGRIIQVVLLNKGVDTMKVKVLL